MRIVNSIVQPFYRDSKVNSSKKHKTVHRRAFCLTHRLLLPLAHFWSGLEGNRAEKLRSYTCPAPSLSRIDGCVLVKKTGLFSPAGLFKGQRSLRNKRLGASQDHGPTLGGGMDGSSPTPPNTGRPNHLIDILLAKSICQQPKPFLWPSS